MEQPEDFVLGAFQVGVNRVQRTRRLEAVESMISSVKIAAFVAETAAHGRPSLARLNELNLTFARLRLAVLTIQM